MADNRTLGFLLVALILATGVAAGAKFNLPPLPPPFEYGDVLIGRAAESGDSKPVLFSHWTHRTRYTCRVCHFELDFAFEANVTEITEAKIRGGEYCGACHNGTTAFGVTDGSCQRCHGRDRKQLRDTFEKLSRRLPSAPYGNEIDWTKAWEKGEIQPEQSILDDDFEPMPFARDLELQARWIMIPPAVFPHGAHQKWLDCANCHPDIFNVKKKTTEHFEMMGDVSRRLAPRVVPVIAIALAAVPALGSTDDPTAVCEWVETFSDAPRREAGPTPDAGGCSAALACLDEAGGSSHAAGTEPAARCEPIEGPLDDTSGRIRRLLERIERQAAEASSSSRHAESRQLQRCARFLRCLDRNKENVAGPADTSRPVPWKEEFERICGHTQDAMTLSTPRLRQLLDDSEKLIRRIEELGDSRSKVYLQRLKMCRDLFRYMLDVRQDS